VGFVVGVGIDGYGGVEGEAHAGWKMWEVKQIMGDDEDAVSQGNNHVVYYQEWREGR